MLIMPMVIPAIKLVMDLIKVARETKEMSQKEFDEIKKQLDKEFAEFPTWNELGTNTETSIQETLDILWSRIDAIHEAGDMSEPEYSAAMNNYNSSSDADAIVALERVLERHSKG